MTIAWMLHRDDLAERERWRSHLEALREHWGHERWIAGGHSWGALLALLYALEHRRRVDAVVCFCIGNLWRRVEGAPAAPRRPPPAPADVHQLWLRSFADRARGEAVLARGPLYRFPRNEQVVGAVSVDLERRIGRDFDRELAALEVPVLILHGTEDHNLWAAERLALALGRATLRILPRTAHVPWLEDPPAVRAALRGFLDAGG